jgi:hypothetical protein
MPFNQSDKEQRSDPEREQRDTASIHTPHRRPVPNEISLHDLLLPMWNGKWLIFGFILLTTIAAYVITTHFITPVYQARAVLSPNPSSERGITAYLNSTLLKRTLVEKYDLLPVLYAARWDEDTKQWRVGQPPSTNLALAEGKLPFRLEGSYTLVWEGPDPSFNVLMLMRIIEELEVFITTELITEAQIKLTILEQELAPLSMQSEKLWDKPWVMDQQKFCTI